MGTYGALVFLAEHARAGSTHSDQLCSWPAHAQHEPGARAANYLSSAMLKLQLPVTIYLAIFFNPPSFRFTHDVPMAESDVTPASSAAEVPTASIATIPSRPSEQPLRELIRQEIAAALRTSDTAGTSAPQASASNGECTHVDGSLFYTSSA